MIVRVGRLAVGGGRGRRLALLEGEAVNVNRCNQFNISRITLAMQEHRCSRAGWFALNMH